MAATRPKAELGLQTYNIPLFLVTPTSNEKVSEIFELTNIGHFIVRVETYRGQGDMTKCFNFQRFGYV
jgi:hypothetical protein